MHWQAMKVENMLKIKEEFDYKSLSRRLEIELDKHIAENERRQKAFDDEIERMHLESQSRIAEVEQNFADALEVSWVSIQTIQVSLVFMNWFPLLAFKWFGTFLCCKFEISLFLSLYRRRGSNVRWITWKQLSSWRRSWY